MATYRERLTPSPLYWALVPVGGLFGAAALLPLGTPQAVLVGAGTAAVVAYLLSRTATRVEVTDGELRVGRAHLPLAVVAAVDQLDAAGSRHALGPGLDARAFVCTRPWIRTHVRVHLTDPQDPTPYWLIGTRRPDALARAVAG